MGVFEEEQRAPNLLIWLTLGIIAASGAIAYFAEPDAEASQMTLLVLSAAAAFTLILFQTMVMKTVVDGHGVDIHTLYVIRRRISFVDIASARAVTYRPLRDYGGWGLRISGKGKAYNMRGDRGVQLVLKNGGRVLIGSQRAEELATAINSGLQSA